MYWLGVDVGTGGTRALLTDERGRVLHSAVAAHAEMRMERPLWAEQDPHDWWRAGCEAIRKVLEVAGIGGDAIAGVGFSGQMHGLVLLDDRAAVIRPALIWCDARSQPQVDAVNRTVGQDAVLRFTANPVLTGFTLPKLLWVREHEPAAFARAKKLLLPKDYVRFRLTGEYATDVSDASGTSLFDVVQRRWSNDMTAALDLPATILPTAHESIEIAGAVSQAAAAATGLKAGTPVVAGAGDQAASAVGNGIVASGAVSCTIGTSGVVFAHLAAPAYDPRGAVHTFCHAVPGAWHVMGVTMGAGLSLQWFRNRLARDAGYDELTAEAEQSPPGAHGLFWLPYLMGERTPHLDASARAGWIGLTAKHERADLIRAILEGVCYSQRDCLDLIEQLGEAPAAIRLSGGGARSLFWQRLFADVFGRPVAVLETQEGSAYGAALLAIAGTVRQTNLPALCGEAIREKRVCQPDPEARQFYERSVSLYRELYPALRPVFRHISEWNG